MPREPKHPHQYGAPLPRAMRDAAANWIVRRDWGLSPAETAELNAWLQADPRHAEAFERAAAAWKVLEQLPARVPRPVAERCERRVAWGRWSVGGLAAAASVAVALYIGRTLPDSSPAAGASAAVVHIMEANASRSVLLSDGTLVRMNTGARIGEHFTAEERSVRLLSGEAHFSVVSDPGRPFAVHAGGVAVRAVGTAFNVHLQDAAVDVLVTEGKVQVDVLPTSRDEHAAPADPAGTAAAAHPRNTGALVEAGQRATVVLKQATRPEVAVSDLDPVEISRVLAWRRPLLRLGGATLAELAVEFEQQTGRRIVLEDATLGQLRIGGRFPPDDVEGFVGVLEENYGLKARHEPDGSIALSR
jgi:transmembrane sensor